MTTLAELKHNRSEKDFPDLKLEPGEHVELVMTRAKITLALVWFFVIVALLILTLCVLMLPEIAQNLLYGVQNSQNLRELFAFVLFLIYIIVLAVGLISTRIHFNNKLYVTNMRAIQVSANGLTDRSTQVIELLRIEDVSYKQESLTQRIFGFGTVRLSTVGDETTYTFPYVATPEDELQTISHLIHEVKTKKAKAEN